MTHEIHPLITNDATLFGILSRHAWRNLLDREKRKRPFWKKFYKYVPALLSVLLPAITAYRPLKSLTRSRADCISWLRVICFPPPSFYLTLEH